MAKLHSTSPREITSPFPCAIISKLHSKACNYRYIFHSYLCNKSYWRASEASKTLLVMSMEIRTSVSNTHAHMSVLRRNLRTKKQKTF